MPADHTASLASNVSACRQLLEPMVLCGNSGPLHGDSLCPETFYHVDIPGRKRSIPSSTFPRSPEPQTQPGIIPQTHSVTQATLPGMAKLPQQGKDVYGWHGKHTLTQQAAWQRCPVCIQGLALKGDQCQPGSPTQQHRT